MKYVTETAAGKSIGAFLIMRGNKQVAKVLTHYGNSGNVLVNVIQSDDAAQKSAKASGASIDDMRAQHSSAGGYGYDKSTAALVGLYIDGHEMTDHCSRKGAPKRPANGLKRWPRDHKPRAGYMLANYQAKYITLGFSGEKQEREGFEGNDGYESYYRISGLEYLTAKGYTVIRVL